MQYISIFIPRKNGRIVNSWILFERAGHTYLLELWGVVEGMKNCHLGPLSWQHLKGYQVRTTVLSCPEKPKRVRNLKLELPLSSHYV